MLIVKDKFGIPSVVEAFSDSEKFSIVEVADSDKKVTIVEQQPLGTLPGNVYDQSHVDRLEDGPSIKPQFTIPVVYLHSSLDLYHTKEPELLTKAVYVDVPYEFVQPKTTIDLADEQHADKVKKSTAISRQAITQREILTVLPDSFFIKHTTRFVKILFSEILVLKAEAAHTTFITDTKKYTIRMSLTAVLERLKTANLVRVHRSFAVNQNRIESFSEYEISIEKHTIPLSRHFRQEFFAAIGTEASE